MLHRPHSLETAGALWLGKQEPAPALYAWAAAPSSLYLILAAVGPVLWQHFRVPVSGGLFLSLRGPEEAEQGSVE